MDALAAFLVAAHVVLLGPHVGRLTDDCRKLVAHVNDEPMITQQLIGMASAPLGNPANAMRDPLALPSEWEGIRYFGVYYGGTYLGAAFAGWLPLRCLGLPDLPTAPVVLRVLSLLFGALCLVVVYNLGKLVSSRWAAIAAGLLLLSDPNFLYYSSIVHPDTLQSHLVLLAWWVAIRHAGSGTRDSLIALGILAGLVQGTKMGGPILIPMAILATVWGGRATGIWGARWWTCSTFYRRLALLGVTSVIAWVLSTPYAFFDSFYFDLWRKGWTAYQSGSLEKTGISAWLASIWAVQGPILSTVQAAVIAAVLVGYVRTSESPALMLGAVLILSTIAWFMFAVRVWIAPGYLLPAVGPAALLACDGARRLLSWGDRFSWRLVAPCLRVAITALAVMLLVQRSAPTVAATLRLAAVDRTTGMQVGRWLADHVPAESRIIVDDACYVPSRYRNFQLHGGLLTYSDLERERPDFFVLSSEFVEAPHYRQLALTQSYERGREGPLSLLLYQDLLLRGTPSQFEPVATIEGIPVPFSDPLPFGLHVVLDWASLAYGPGNRVTGPRRTIFRSRR